MSRRRAFQISTMDPLHEKINDNCFLVTTKKFKTIAVLQSKEILENIRKLHVLED